MSESQPPVSQVAPQAAPLPGPRLELGGPGARLMGYIVDVLISVAAMFFLFIVFALLATILPILGTLGIFLSFVIVQLAYFPYFWAKSGQTPGMKLAKVKVVRNADGGPITAGQAILRLLGFWVSQAVFYIGFLWVFIDKRKRGWFDLIAGTIVIKA